MRLSEEGLRLKLPHFSRSREVQPTHSLEAIGRPAADVHQSRSNWHRLIWVRFVQFVRSTTLDVLCVGPTRHSILIRILIRRTSDVSNVLDL